MASRSSCFSALTTLPSYKKSLVVQSHSHICMHNDNKNESPHHKSSLSRYGSSQSNKYYHVLSKHIPKQKLPPSPPVHYSIPGIGYSIETLLNMSSHSSRAKRYGDIYTSNFYVHKMHFICNPYAMLEMIKNSDIFRSTGSSISLANMFGAEAMILLDHDKHAKVRALIAPAFSPHIFPSYFEIVKMHVQKCLQQIADSVATNGNTVLAPKLRHTYLCFTISFTTGIDVESRMAQQIFKNFQIVGMGFFSPPFGPIYAKAMKATQQIIHILCKLFRKYLVEKAHVIEKLRQSAERDRLSYSYILKGDLNVILIAIADSDLKTGENVTNDPEIIKQLARLIFGLWFAGYSTSSSTACCAIFELGMKANISEALLDEQEKIIQIAGTPNLTYDQVNSKMPLLDSYITEILRVYPAARGVTRKVERDVCVLGRHIRGGDTIFFDFYSALRDPRVYGENAEQVQMARFLKNGHSNSTIPAAAKIFTFGIPGSAHYCLGASLSMMELKTTLAILLRQYTMKLDESQSKQFSRVAEIVPKSKIVIRSFERRRDDEEHLPGEREMNML